MVALTHRRTGSTAASSGTLTLAVSAIGVSYLAVLGYMMHTRPYGYWGAILLLPILFALGAPIVVRVTRNDAEQIRTIALVGLAAKLIGAFARFHLIVGAYGGLADAQRYHLAGVDIAAQHHGILAPLNALPTGQGTQFIEQLTGLVYTIIGPSRLGGFVVFSFLAYWGLFCFQRAVATAAPALDQVRYAKLVFLWPSLLFWPSSIGKEAWMILCLGVAALGAARLFVGRLNGAIVFGLGAWGAFMVRPHMGVLLVGALAVALVMPAGRQAAGKRGSSPFVRVALFLLVLGALTFTLGRTASYFGVQGGATDNVDQILSITEKRTGQGGSEIDSVRANSPVQYPRAVMTVLFRPFLFEARSFTSLIAAAEGTLLGGLTLLSLRRIRHAVRGSSRSRYVVYAVVYAAMFIFAFSSFSNLGILARQRTQVMPLVFVLFAGAASSLHRDSTSRMSSAVGHA